jgi:SAM-dependent methyltransferase
MKITITKKKKLPLESKLEIINSPVWPVAIDEELICRTTEDHAVRACSIIEGFLKNVNGKKFYDPTNDEFIRREVSIRGGITDANTSFDVVLLYDTLDHITDQVNYLKDIAQKTSEQGRIYVRCHPWSSRHGTHLYHQKNKAFLHLFLTSDELASLNLIEKPTFHAEVSSTYQRWFKDAGLKVLSTEIIETPVEPIFSQLIARGILDNNKEMNISFVDYILSV